EMLAVTAAKPRWSASFRVFRSIAWLAARRTRRSCQGDFGSHCTVKSRKMTVLVRTAVSLSPGVRWTSWATGPVRKYTTSASPRLRAAAQGSGEKRPRGRHRSGPPTHEGPPIFISAPRPAGPQPRDGPAALTTSEQADGQSPPAYDRCAGRSL